MALTKKDLQQIQELLAEQLVHERQHLRIALDQQSQDIKRDIRDEMDARFTAFENKINHRFAEIHADIKEIVTVLFTFVPERFEKLEHDVVRIKTHLGMA